MTDINITREVVEAAAWAMCDEINGEGAWDETPFRYRPMWRSAARAAIAAALNAWPKSYSLTENDSAEIRNVAVIILPLPQENSDE